MHLFSERELFSLLNQQPFFLDESVWYSLVKCSLCAMTLTLFKGKKSMDFIAISSYLMAIIMYCFQIQAKTYNSICCLSYGKFSFDWGKM